MSTDLELCKELPKIRLSSIRIRTPPASESVDDTDGTVIQRRSLDDDDEQAECRTPTSKEHKIPVLVSCPPAPRKPRRVASCKRKLTELEFFDIVNRDEVDAFFRSSFDELARFNGNGSAAKRRNCCSWSSTLIDELLFRTKFGSEL
ncbi:hypothetical protein FNV43_RR25217 [Rhamnella rubrinervis]|uniref:Cyclin-dependent protein kinase inhibitor SMR1 n=1 Tax=Rhamnella rubrinervis TaxID=2594499 RepID=A0A8K0DTS2_9ROSA|nr:hypothetical protein FNV43_RR25217 [Rhamnella rubrinervis]